MINRRITASSWPKHPVGKDRQRDGLAWSWARKRRPHDQCIAWKTDVASRVRYAGLMPALDPSNFGKPRIGTW